jgi:dihydrofolate reductase
MFSNPLTVKLIAAVGRNRVIGKGNDLPWRYPGDLKFFKEKTMYSPIIMGRNTWESIKSPLPYRYPIVVTSKPENYKTVCAVRTLDEALKAARGYNMTTSTPGAFYDTAWVIGGARMYAEAMRIADEIWLTNVPDDVPDDGTLVRFPEISFLRFMVASTDKHPYQPGLTVTHYKRR